MKIEMINTEIKKLSLLLNPKPSFRHLAYSKQS